MPKNQIDASGIQTETYPEIVEAIVNGTPDTPGLVQIYGADINVDSNSPDGQMVNIFALSKADVLDLLTQIYNSFDPDQAVGVALDGISQLCGLSRKGGTYTEVAVKITVDRSVNLNGLDNPSTPPFTVADGNGNVFYLIDSASLSTGDNTLNFQAAEIGFVQVTANTITIAVSVILGVTAVTNVGTPYVVGADQESDAAFRLRRSRSTALPAHGFLQSLYAGLNSIEGVAEAVVYENVTNAVDANSIPAHSIWVIVDGGSDADVADMIYRYRNAGAGMKGAESVTLTQIDASPFTVYFDRAVYQDLYIQFTVTSLTGGSIDEAAIKDAIVANYLLGIYDAADISSIAAIVKAIDPTLVITDVGVSDTNGSFVDYKFPADKKSKWVLATARITIST